MEMSKRKRNRAAARAEPSTKRSVTFYCDSSQFGSLKCRGYTTLADNPEIAAKLEADIRKNFDKLMTGQSRVAAKAAGRAVDVSADDFDDAD